MSKRRVATIARVIGVTDRHDYDPDRLRGRDGIELELSLTRLEGCVRHGAVWFTQTPKQLREQGCEVAQARRAPRRAAILRKADGTERPIRNP